MTVNKTSQSAVIRPPAAAQNRAADRFVLVAQSLVVLAFAVGSSVQAGLHPMIATAAALAVVVALFVTRRGTKARRPAKTARVSSPPQAEPITAAAETAPLLPAGYIPPPSYAAEEDFAPEWPAELDYAALDRREMPPAAAMSPPPVMPVPPPMMPYPEFTAQAAQPATTPPPMPRFSATPVANAHHYAPELPGYRAALQPQQAAPIADQDFWNLRPSQQRFEAAVPPPVPAAPEPSATLRETDVEAIQTLIKKLADEVNATEQHRDSATSTPQLQAEGASADAPASPPPAFEPDRAVASSLDALRVTAETMRQPSHLVFGHELPPPIPTQPARATLLAEAIAAGRADVLLEPILGLQSQEAQHFEVAVRLRAEDGSPLALDTNDSELRGTGLLPLFDAAKFSRTATVARRLSERGKTGAVFSSYSGEALTDRTFRNDATAIFKERPTRAGQFIFTFSQSDARSFEAPEWSAIAEMRDQGFRFAMSAVTDLDMDIEGLVAAGFLFVKLDADVFLNGLASPAGLIPAADVCRYLAGLGLALVVEHIDDEAKFARVFGFGALLGQGQLFGGARVLKAEAAKGSQAA